MSKAAPAVASALSLPGFPRWSVLLLLVFFLASLVAVIALLRQGHRRAEHDDDDPWPGWQHHDGYDAADVLTDPNLLPVTGYEPEPEPGYEPPPRYGVYAEPVADITSFDMPAISGEVVNRHNWAQAMTVPAPAITAAPTSLAQEWIAAWEAGDPPPADVFTGRILAGAQT